MRLRLRVGKLMQEQQMSVATLQERAKIANGTARALARGSSTRFDVVVLERVAKALGVRPLDLFEQETESVDVPGQYEAEWIAA